MLSSIASVPVLETIVLPFKFMLSTSSAVRVPKLVMLDCAAVCKVPVNVEPVIAPLATIVPFTVTLSSTAKVPVDDATVLPSKLMLSTVKADKVPSDVMLGCAAVVSVPLTLPLTDKEESDNEPDTVSYTH